MPERSKIMNKMMMNMEELEQVNGGNFLTDAWDWLCKKYQNRSKARTPEEREQEILDRIRPKMLPTNEPNGIDRFDFVRKRETI